MSLSSVPGSLQPPLKARNGHTLKVLGVARISTEHQDALSLADQEALYRRWLDQHPATPYRLDMTAGSGSGERPARHKEPPIPEEEERLAPRTLRRRYSQVN